jgi:hypothetical protein
MKTYLSVVVSTEGKKFSDIAGSLLSIGFKPLRGEYDYVYEWKKAVEMDELMAFIDKVQDVLKGSNAILKFKTE